MGARTRARRHALDILFQAEVRDVDAPTVLAEYRSRREDADQQDYNPYVVDIVTGTFGKTLGGAAGGFTAAAR